jgi:hypothetical protein
MRDALSDSEKFAIVSLYELLESGNISILAGMDKIQVVACRFPHCELCRVCGHIHAPAFRRTTRFAAVTDATTSGKPFSLHAILNSGPHFTTIWPVIFG